MNDDKQQQFTYLEVEAALCVWECLNDWTLLAHGDVHAAAINDEDDNIKTDWIALRENVGSAEMRHQSIPLGQWCLKVYDICTKHDPDFFDGVAYDWEVIPLILEFAEDGDGKPTMEEGELPPAEQTALLVAHRHLRGEYLADCGREANKQWGYSELVTDHHERVDQAFELGETPAEFVKWLGEKYDLTPASDRAFFTPDDDGDDDDEPDDDEGETDGDDGDASEALDFINRRRPLKPVENGMTEKSGSSRIMGCAVVLPHCVIGPFECEDDAKEHVNAMFGVDDVHNDLTWSIKPIEQP
jgi:hypothetical protein